MANPFTDPDEARNYLSGLSAHQSRVGDTSYLHPDFALRLANSIQQARALGMPVTLESGYRTPTTTGSNYDAQGYSLHGFGAAADVSGIGNAGSPSAALWGKIAAQNGIYNPYGLSDAKEYNHWQLVPWKLEQRPDVQKALIASGGDLNKVWGAVAPVSATQAIKAATAPTQPQQPAQAPQAASTPQAAQAYSQEQPNMSNSPPDDWEKTLAALHNAQPATPAQSGTGQSASGGDWESIVREQQAKDASSPVQSAGQPLGTDPRSGYIVSRNAEGFTSLTDPATGRVMQQFAPGDYERNASQIGSFAEGALSGIPIAGPAVLGGVEKAAAASRALSNGTTYGDELANVRGMAAQDQAAYPKTSIAGNLTGSGLGYMAAGEIPGANMLLGAGPGGVLARSALGAAGNAGVGAADAYARGENPLVGAAFGGAGGAAAPAVGKVLGAVGSGAINKLAAYAPPGVPGLSRGAANVLTTVLNADHPQDVQAALGQMGPLATLADAGPSLQSIASGLASKPGEARSTISDVLTQRNLGRDNRLLGDVDTALGPAESAQSATNNILAQRRLTDAANYSVVHAQNAPVDVSDVVAKIDNALPTAVGSQRTALQNLRSELVKAPATYDEAGNMTAPEQYHDNSELLHNLRQEIDKAVNYGDPALGVPQSAVQRANGSLVMVRNALDSALKTQVPGMAEADAASSALAKRAEAVESGTQLLDSGKTAITPNDFAADRANMEPGVAIAQNKGVRSEIDRLVGTKRNDLVALQNALQGDGGWNTQKLAIAFGEQPTNDLTSAVNREARFAGTHGEVLKNSRTDRSAAARQLLDETDPTRVNLSGVTPTGLVLQGAKTAIVNPLLDVLLKQDSSGRNLEIARALIAQGAQRDALVNRLLPRAAQQNAIARTAASAGRGADYTGNLFTRAAAVNAGQRASR